jgi:hypothetical protein
MMEHRARIDEADRMKRRQFITLLGGAAVAWPLAARAQQPAGKVARIGFLGLAGEFGGAEALRAGLRDLGHVEGSNIIIEWRWAEKVDQLPELAAELVRMKVNVIFAPSSTFVEAARQVTTTVPISALKAVETGGEKLGVQLLMVPAGAVEDFAGAFSTMTRERVNAFLVVASPITVAQRRLLAELAVKHRLPGMFGIKDNVEAGGLMSYAADLNDLYRRAAVYIDKILKGANPANLPVEQASKYQLVINLKTARALGLEVPLTLLARADEVIE